MTPEELAIATRLGVAALGGLMVGIEREWSGGRDGQPTRFAGVRTFLLLGLIGGLAATLQGLGHGAAGVVLVAAVAALAIAAYIPHALDHRPDGTTEVAAILVVGAGFLAGMDLLHVSFAVFAVTALVLVEKGHLHGLVSRIPSETLEAAARFAVLSVVILPLLPAGPYGPEPGFKPQELWALVLIFSGLSFAGYMALRAIGPHRGYGVAGLLGGLISSTAVTLSFSRVCREKPTLGGPLALGVLAACAMLYVRVTAVCLALNQPLGLAVLPYVGLPFLLAAMVVGLVYVVQGKEASEAELPRSPLGLWNAVQLAVLFQVVLYGVHYVRQLFGDAGVLATGALLGLTDMDALIISMVKLARDPASEALAARALGIGIFANTLLKLALAVFIGTGVFRRTVAGGLIGLAVAGGLTLWLL